MIKIYSFVVGAVAALFAGQVSAAPIYDTLHTTIGQLSATAIASTAGPLAISFNLPVATTIVDIQLLMNANVPTDGGSVSVWLVPDDGSGGAGQAGLPAGGTAFTGKVQIGTDPRTRHLSSRAAPRLHKTLASSICRSRCRLRPGNIGSASRKPLEPQSWYSIPVRFWQALEPMARRTSPRQPLASTRWSMAAAQTRWRQAFECLRPRF